MTEVGGSWDEGQSELHIETSMLATVHIRNPVTMKCSKQQQNKNKNTCSTK